MVPNHCTVTLSEDGSATVKAGNGPTIVNGKRVPKGETVPIKAFDRLAVGAMLLLFRVPGKEDPDAEVPTADDAVSEYQVSIIPSITTRV